MLPYVNEKEQIPNDDNESESPSFYEREEKKVKWYNKALLNRPFKVIFVAVIVGVIAPIAVYHYGLASTVDISPDAYSIGSCLVPRVARIPCGKSNVSQHECHPHCCYDLQNQYCFHRFPSRFSYLLNNIWTEDSNLQPRVANAPFMLQQNIPSLRLSIDEITTSHLTVTFHDPQSQPSISRFNGFKGYTYEVTVPEINVEVQAKQGTIFSTVRGPLVAAENIWEIAIQLTNETLFGLGEIPLAPGTVKVIYSNDGRPDVVPLIYAKINSSYHGLLIDNETPTEITILGDNQVLVRSITMDSLKFHLFIGPKPEDIMKDVMLLIDHDFELKYWMLGPHVCSETDSDLSTSLDELNEFLIKAESENLVFESHCGVAPIVFNEYCNTEHRNILTTGVQNLKNSFKRFIPHVSPYVKYINESEQYSCIDLSDNTTLLINSETEEFHIGLANEIDVVYPDYTNENVVENIISAIWPEKGLFDGIILENNWPLDTSNKSFNDTYDSLPYFNWNFENAAMNTLFWNIENYDQKLHMYKHNKYGNEFIEAMEKYIARDIPFWSTSHWLNGNVAINRQNIDTSWTNLHRELRDIALGGVSGHWFWSSPICGDTDNYDPSTQLALCVKWYMAATYFPQIKIHSKAIAKDPFAFPPMEKNFVTKALRRRMQFSTYFYTVLQTGPLIRPMFYQFPNSYALHKINTQFAVGDKLVIVPNLLPRQSHVIVWLPPGDWYELWSGYKLEGREGDPFTMSTTESDFLTLIGGGSILITQKKLEGSMESTRLHSPYSITVALHCEPDEFQSPTFGRPCSAAGELYMTNDMSIHFEANSQELTIKATGSDYSVFCDEAIWANVIEEINVYGLAEEHNNYDHNKHIEIDIDLCKLKIDSEINLRFIDH